MGIFLVIWARKSSEVALFDTATNGEGTNTGTRLAASDQHHPTGLGMRRECAITILSTTGGAQTVEKIEARVHVGREHYSRYFPPGIPTAGVSL